MIISSTPPRPHPRICWLPLPGATQYSIIFILFDGNQVLAHANTQHPTQTPRIFTAQNEMKLDNLIENNIKLKHFIWKSNALNCEKVLTGYFGLDKYFKIIILL
jgi:hypothetical protein